MQFRRHLAHDRLDYVPRAKREAAVVEDRAQAVFAHRSFQYQQRAQLRVTVLLHNETEIVVFDELFHGLIEWEAANAHVIGRNAARRKHVYRFVHSRIAASDGNDTDAGIWLPLND